MNRTLLIVGGVVGLLSLAGCAKYYQVTDPLSGRTYYTTKLEKKGGGAYRFTDDRTQAEVTLQNSEVLPISEETYRNGRATAAPAK